MMLKFNLPVIVLRGIVLLPNNDIKLEFSDEKSKNIIDSAELFSDGNLLVVSKLNPLEESLDIDELPKYGVIAKISHRIELPNNNTRVLLTGITRAYVHEYLSGNHKGDIIESIMGDIEDEYDEEVELIIPRNGGAYEVNGEADPEEVLELFGYELEENHEYDTIAGFVTDLLGYIPEEEGEHPKVRYKDIMFKVKSVENNCIEQIIVRPCKEEELAEKE